MSERKKEREREREKERERERGEKFNCHLQTDRLQLLALLATG